MKELVEALLSMSPRYTLFVVAVIAIMAVAAYLSIKYD